MHRVKQAGWFADWRLIAVSLVVVLGASGSWWPRSARGQSEGVLQDSSGGMPDGFAADSSAATAARAKIQPRVQALADEWNRSVGAGITAERSAPIPHPAEDSGGPPRMDSGDPNPDGVVVY